MASIAEQRTLPDGAVATLCVLSGASAAIHFAVIGEHFAEYWAFGTFFLVLAWFQAAWAVLVVTRPSRSLLLIGAIVNAAVVVIWLWSRTLGLPIGPEAGETEPAQLIDVVATVAEGLLVLGCLAMLEVSRLAGLTARSISAVFISAALVTVGATSWALADSSGGEHGATSDEDGPHEHMEHMDHSAGSHPLSHRISVR